MINKTVACTCQNCGMELKIKANGNSTVLNCPSCGGVLVQECATKVRYWHVALLIALLIISFVKPIISNIIGLVLCAIVVMFFIPKTRHITSRVLSLNTGKKWENGVRLAVCVFLGVIILCAGMTGTAIRDIWEKNAAIDAAQKAKEKRLAKKRDAVIVALAKEVQKAIDFENVSLAEKKLDELKQISHDTKLIVVKNLSVRLANLKVNQLLPGIEQALEQKNIELAKSRLNETEDIPYSETLQQVKDTRLAIANLSIELLEKEAVAAIDDGNIELAKTKIQAAIDEPFAPDESLALSLKLKKEIANATDQKHVYDVLADIPDEEFAKFTDKGELPEKLACENKTLNEMAVKLATAKITEAKAERQKRKEEELAEKKRREEERQRNAELAEMKRREAEAAAIAEKERYEKYMGDTLTIGYTSYAVWDARWSKHLSRNKFMDKSPNATWLILKMTVRNDDKKARMIPPFYLIDNEGGEHECAAEVAFLENGINLMDSLNPGVSKNGYILFDVPQDRTYKLKVSGGYWSGKTGYINLAHKQKR